MDVQSGETEEEEVTRETSRLALIYNLQLHVGYSRTASNAWVKLLLKGCGSPICPIQWSKYSNFRVTP